MQNSNLLSSLCVFCLSNRNILVELKINQKCKWYNRKKKPYEKYVEQRSHGFKYSSYSIQSVLQKDSCIPAGFRSNVLISKVSGVNPTGLQNSSDYSKAGSMKHCKTVRRTIKIKWHTSVKHGTVSLIFRERMKSVTK